MNESDAELDRGQSDELRDLYKRLQPPPLADELAAADPETQRAVHWMQGAWRDLAPPRTLAPSGLARARRSSRRASFARVAAAAAVLLLVAGAVLWRQLSTARLSAPARVAQAPLREPARIVEVIDVRHDQVELRAGPVRILLLDPPSESSVEPPGS